MISFASVGHDPSRPPSPEFVGSATAGGRPALFLADESRSWANADGMERLLAAAIERLAARQPISRILCIGQSMGAFAALVAASGLKVDAVLAFGPQFSVDPSHMPDEARWSIWTRRITTFRHPVAPLPAGPRISLFHGLKDDAAQARAFPRQAGVDHVLFPELGHSGLCAHLKQRGAFAGLIDAAFADDRRRLLRIAASAGGRLRQRLPGWDQLPR